MNRNKIITGIVSVFIIGVLLFSFFKIFNNFKKVDISSFKNLEYSYYDGWHKYGSVSYKVKCNRECYLEINPYGLPDSIIMKSKIADSQIQAISEVLQKYQVEKWNNFDKSNNNVLDGSSFSFKLVTNDNKKISASGYMEYPNNFKKAIKELETIFEQIAETNHKKVYDLDYFSGFNKDNIVKVVEKETSVSGTEEYEYESKEKIEEAFHWFEDYLIINSNKMRCDDNSVSYTFIMNNGKKYVIKTECDWIVIDGIKYYYYEKNW